MHGAFSTQLPSIYPPSARAVPPALTIYLLLIAVLRGGETEHRRRPDDDRRPLRRETSRNWSGTPSGELYCHPSTASHKRPALLRCNRSLPAVGSSCSRLDLVFRSEERRQQLP